MGINDGKRLLRHFISKLLCAPLNVLSVDKGLLNSIGKDERWNVIWSYDHDILAHDELLTLHYTDVIMGTMAPHITSLTIVYSIVYSGADQRKYQSSASQAFVRGFHRRPVNSPHKWPVTRRMFPFDDVIMLWGGIHRSRFLGRIQWSPIDSPHSGPLMRSFKNLIVVVTM